MTSSRFDFPSDLLSEQSLEWTSSAMNLCLLHFVWDLQRYKPHEDEFKLLDQYLRNGPTSIDPELLNGFLDKGFKLELADED
jgi:hypothetical protein